MYKKTEIDAFSIYEFELRDRVECIKDINSGIVPKGTLGKVAAIRKNGTPIIQFDNGARIEINYHGYIVHKYE